MYYLVYLLVDLVQLRTHSISALWGPQPVQEGLLVQDSLVLLRQPVVGADKHKLVGGHGRQTIASLCLRHGLQLVVALSCRLGGE